MLSIMMFLASQASDFTISDTTDNQTGKRTVYALQMAPDSTEVNFLKFECVEKVPAVTFDFYDFTAPEWAVITLRAGDSPDIPFIAQRVADRTSELRIYGDARALIRRLGEGEVREFTVHGSPGSRSVSFGMSGLTQSWQRVVANCR